MALPRTRARVVLPVSASAGTPETPDLGSPGPLQAGPEQALPPGGGKRRPGRRSPGPAAAARRAPPPRPVPTSAAGVSHAAGLEGPHCRFPLSSGTPGRSAPTPIHSHPPPPPPPSRVRTWRKKTQAGRSAAPGGRAALQPATAPSGVAEGTCHAVPARLRQWEHLVPASTAPSWTGGCHPDPVHPSVVQDTNSLLSLQNRDFCPTS